VAAGGVAMIENDRLGNQYVPPQDHDDVAGMFGLAFRSLARPIVLKGLSLVPAFVSSPFGDT
jgi:hypothetical protein